MAWYPNARKMELQPESDAQPAIRPTQLIFHSVAAPWTPERIYEYWRDSTNLESHFGVGFDGAIAQYIGTQTRADSNMYANRRSDGTGAVSVETASNLNHTDPWTDAQVSALIKLGVWMHTHHGVPLRISRSYDDPGFGIHRMFSQWSDGGTACPGDARAAQFRNVVFPGIVKAAGGKPTDGGSSSGGTYTVMKGDTLSGIAAKVGVVWQMLADLNGVKAPYTIYPGQVLKTGKPKPAYQAFPGAAWFKGNPNSPIVTAMGKRLVAEGCSAYSSGPGAQWTSADRESFRKWQRKLGDSPAYCDGWPGKKQWDALKVPSV
ncbi:peptidoglycan-binding protein [Streptomyces sp. NPDC001407]|uniref:peptidoglycan-binding protein n=1 Tax=Streptomyces sp. NPDC001407 TaxID=3364573 RepID=UPI0036949D7B